MNFLRKLKKGAVAATAVTLTSFLALGTGTALAAAPADMPTNGGTITIHKHAKSDAGATAHPDGSGKVSGKALNNISFTVKKVVTSTGQQPIDLTDNKNWEKISSITSESLSSHDWKLGATVKEGLTSDGILKTDHLDNGLYYIEETSYGDNPVTAVAEPFFVTVPFPDKDNTKKWITDVHVYPKNVLKTPGTKEVQNDTAIHKVGDEIEWKISTTASSNSPKNYGVIDELQPYLEYVQGSISLVVKGQTRGWADMVDVETGTKNDAATDNKPRKYVKFTIKSAGLKNIQKDDKVDFVFKTKINTLPEGGIVKNSAWPIDNEYNPFEDPQTPNGKIPGEPPIVPEEDPYFGQYKFKKVDKSDQKLALSGAEFGVYKCKPDTVHDGQYLEELADEVTVLAKATSGEDGVVDFKGVYLGKHTKGTLPTDVKGTFCIKEIAAPSGYTLSEQVHKIEIKAGSVTTETDSLDIVTNTKQAGPNLPLTGAAGTFVLTLTGLGLIVLGGVLYTQSVRSRKH